MLADNALDILAGYCRYSLRPQFTAAFHKSKNGGLGLCASSACSFCPLAGVFVLFLAADVSFIRFNFTLYQFGKRLQSVS